MYITILLYYLYIYIEIAYMLNLLQDKFCFFVFLLGGFMWPSGEITSIVTVFPIDPVLSITDAVVLPCCR